MIHEKTTRPQGPTAFFFLLIGLTIMVLVMIRTYRRVIFFSLALVFILKPLFDRLVNVVRGRKSLAADVTLIITAAIPVILFSIAGFL